MSEVAASNRSEGLIIEQQDGAGDIRILQLAGPLILRTVFEFQKVARVEESRAIVIDIRDVPYMDSAGLGAIVGVFVSCQRNKRGFAIIGLSDRIRTLFQVAQVDGMLPCFASLEEASAKLLA